MLDVVIVIMSIWGIAWGAKESTLLSGFRNWLMMRSEFFAKLFYCYFCVGFHSGWIVYLLHTPKPEWTIPAVILWAFAGSVISGLFEAVYSRLTFYKTN